MTPWSQPCPTCGERDCPWSTGAGRCPVALGTYTDKTEEPREQTMDLLPEDYTLAKPPPPLPLWRRILNWFWFPQGVP